MKNKKNFILENALHHSIIPKKKSILLILLSVSPNLSFTLAKYKQIHTWLDLISITQCHQTETWPKTQHFEFHNILFFPKSSCTLLSPNQIMSEQRKAVIKNADMSEDMQQDAVDCASQALSKYNIEKVSSF